MRGGVHRLARNSRRSSARVSHRRAARTPAPRWCCRSHGMTRADVAGRGIAGWRNSTALRRRANDARRATRGGFGASTRRRWRSKPWWAHERVVARKMLVGDQLGDRPGSGARGDPGRVPRGSKRRVLRGELHELLRAARERQCSWRWPRCGRARRRPATVNNAYGVQSRSLCALVTKAWRRGRVDGVVQSTDKNFLVPVGGAVLVSPARDPALTDAVRKKHTPQSTISSRPHADALITRAHGRRGVARDRRLRARRPVARAICFMSVARLRGGARLDARASGDTRAPISMGVTLSALVERGSARIATFEYAERAPSRIETTPRRRRLAAAAAVGDVVFERRVSKTRWPPSAPNGTRGGACGKTQQLGGIHDLRGRSAASHDMLARAVIPSRRRRRPAGTSRDVRSAREDRVAEASHTRCTRSDS